MVTKVRNMLKYSHILLLILMTFCSLRKPIQKENLSVDVILPGDNYVDNYDYDADTSLYNRYQVLYSDSLTQTLILPENYDVREFLFKGREEVQIDTVKYKVRLKEANQL